MNDKEKIKIFWDEKEKETNSKLIIQTAVQYKQGYINLIGPVPGLLYLMANGFYFENFKSNNLFNDIIFRNDEFEKINIHIPIKLVTNMYDFLGNKKRVENTFKKKIKNFIFPKPNELNIEYYNEKNESIVMTFVTIIDPIIICEEFYKITT